jgi:hypothetical protein
MLEVVPCQSCAGPTTFTTELQPLGSEAGHRVYYCDVCKRHTWTTWHFVEQQRQQSNSSR